jgi:hypothetical protein
MIGPYCLESCHKEWCGDEGSIWCRFPIIGSGLGPGGVDDVLLLLFNLCIWMVNRIKIGKRERSTRKYPMVQPYKLRLYFPNL